MLTSFVSGIDNVRIVCVVNIGEIGVQVHPEFVGDLAAILNFRQL